MSLFYLHTFEFMNLHSFYGKAVASNYSSTEHSLPPTINNSTIVVQSSHIKIIRVTQDIFYYRYNRSMTFSYMAYMLSTCEGYFSLILSAVHCESSRLTEMHKLSRNAADLYVLS